MVLLSKSGHYIEMLHVWNVRVTVYISISYSIAHPSLAPHYLPPPLFSNVLKPPISYLVKNTQAGI